MVASHLMRCWGIATSAGDWKSGLKLQGSELMSARALPPSRCLAFFVCNPKQRFASHPSFATWCLITLLLLRPNTSVPSLFVLKLAEVSVFPFLVIASFFSVVRKISSPAFGFVGEAESFRTLSEETSRKASSTYRNIFICGRQSLLPTSAPDADRLLVSTPQVKQIAGRAGRRNSSHPEGLATTFMPEDLPKLREAMAAPMDTAEKGGLFPIFEQMELFAGQLPDVRFPELLDK